MEDNKKDQILEARRFDEKRRAERQARNSELVTNKKPRKRVKSEFFEPLPEGVDGTTKTISGNKFHKKQDIYKIERDARDLANKMENIKDTGSKAAKAELSSEMAKVAKRADALGAADAFERGLSRRVVKTAGKGLKGVLGAIPLLGGLAAAAASGDASAAVPVLGDAEDIGPEKGSLESKFESGDELSPEEYNELRRRALENKLGGL